MFLNEKDVRMSEERRKDLWREAKQDRLAKESRWLDQKTRSTHKTSPVWMRVIWILF